MLSGIHDTLMKVTLQTKTTAKKRGRANYLYDVQAWFYELARLPDELRRCVLLLCIIRTGGITSTDRSVFQTLRCGEELTACRGG